MEYQRIKALQRDTKRYHSLECNTKDYRVNKGTKEGRIDKGKGLQRKREKEGRKEGKEGTKEVRQKGIRNQESEKESGIRAKKKVGFFFLYPPPKKTG